LFVKTPAFAQSQIQPQSQPVNSYTAPNTNPDVPNNLHTWTQSVMIEVSSALTCQLIGIDSTNPSGKCLGVDSKTNKIGFVTNGGGAVRVMGSLMGMLYTPPFHSGDYFSYLAQNFGLTKHAYAQSYGIGFTGLHPILNIWTAFRNIVYLLFVLVFVVIGIAIMLRVKIDPRTVMTIQNQIPKIIIGILLVTFSFAIAGFLIDLMYVFIYLFYGIFSSIPGSNLQELSPIALQGKTAIGVVSGLSNQGWGVFGFADNIARPISSMFAQLIHLNQDVIRNITVSGTVGDIIGLFNNTTSLFDFGVDVISILSAFQFGAQAATMAPTFLGTTSAPVVGGIAFLGAYAFIETSLRNVVPYAIPFLVILIAVIATLFRLWIVLLLAYVNFLIDVAMAPFWIVSGILPGGEKIGFQAWIRDMVANLAVFPVTLAMLMLGKLFVDGFGPTQTTDFVPPLIGNPGSQNMIGSLLGVGIILITPEVLKMTKAAFKAPKFDIAPIGKMLGVGAGTLTGTAKTSAGSLFAYTHGTLPEPGKDKGVGAVLRRMFGRY
jgi:hypothetical protein